jgi:hypothetical protein
VIAETRKLNLRRKELSLSLLQYLSKILLSVQSYIILVTSSHISLLIFLFLLFSTASFHADIHTSKRIPQPAHLVVQASIPALQLRRNVLRSHRHGSKMAISNDRLDCQGAISVSIRLASLDHLRDEHIVDSDRASQDNADIHSPSRGLARRFYEGKCYWSKNQKYGEYRSDP